MKKQHILIIGCLILACVLLFPALRVLFLLGGADYTTYPEEKAKLWICENPHFEMSYSGIPSETYLEWEGEIIPVFIGLRSSNIDVYRQSEDSVTRDEDILFRGQWRYDGKNMVVEIQDDRIFDGAYTELVFVPQ